MTSAPEISIIVASYNYAEYIGETIESVISQTYTNWELVIVDDGSSDNSVEVISKYVRSDKRIKLYQHDGGINKGLKNTLLLGLQKASADWVSFLESDDIWDEDHLNAKVEAITSHEVDLVFCDVNMFGYEPIINVYKKHFNTSSEVLNRFKYPCKSILNGFSTLNIIPTFSVVTVKKALITQCNFNSPIPQLLDYYIWLQLAKQNCSFYYIDQRLTKWRMHQKSYINQLTDLPLEQKLKWEVKFEEFFGTGDVTAKLIKLHRKKIIKYKILSKILIGQLRERYNKKYLNKKQILRILNDPFLRQ